MELLVPLGLLGLLGIVVLILIYILKPNYQQKVVSSTYVWQLSLKYKRRQIPINRLLSLLILLCQILVITACAFILAQPYLPGKAEYNGNEQIAVIDASANMLAGKNGETRFERAVRQVRALAEETLSSDGVITVILADEAPSVIVQRADGTRLDETLEAIDALLGGEGEEMRCSYTQADVEAAMNLADDILQANPFATVLFYTATTYIDPGEVTVVNMAEEGEWNAGILDAQVSLNDNFYTFTVDLACYGRSDTVAVHCDVYGANEGNQTVNIVYSNVYCQDGETVQIKIDTTVQGDPVNCDTPVYAYDRVHIYVETMSQDSFSQDDGLMLFGGRPESIKIQYATASRTLFFSNVLMAMRDARKLRWNISITEVRTGSDYNETPALSGYDLYIFEGMTPESMPTDGVVLLVAPPEVPSGADFTIDGREGDASTLMYLSPGEPSAVTEGLEIEKIGVTLYNVIGSYEGYEPLLYIDNNPVLLVKNQDTAKVAILAFSLKFSTFAIQTFADLFYNLFDYYLPSTVTEPDGSVGFSFEIGESVKIDGRGTDLVMTAPGGTTTNFESVPTLVKAEKWGEYSVTQKLISGATVTSSFYVKINASQSNILPTEDTLYNPAFPEKPSRDDLDLLLYFAAALTAILFIEWLLQVKENY